MKRLLSILLAITMIAAMLPTAFAGEADTRETITLDLHQNNLSEKDAGALTHNATEATAAGQAQANSSAYIADLVVKDGSYEWVAEKSVADNTVSTAGNQYGIHGRRISYTTASYTGSSWDKTWNAWPFFSKPQNVMFTVKTAIPEGAAGYYNIKVTGAVYNCGGEYAVYVNGEYAGDIYGYAAASGYESKEWTLSNAIELPEGDVEISLRAVKFYRDRIEEGKGGVGETNNMASIYLGLVELVPTSEPTISEVESTIPETIEKDKTAELSAQVKMSDGAYRAFGYTDAGEIPTNDNVVTVTSSDTSVIEVTEVVNVEKDIPGDLSQTFDPTTVTYKLTALKGGSSTITVKAIVDGLPKEITKTVTVPTERETITLDLHQNNLSEKDAGALTHNATEATAAGQAQANSSAYIADLVVKDGSYEWVAEKSVADNTVSTAGNQYGIHGRRISYTTASYTGSSWDKTWNAWPFFSKPQNVMFTVKTAIPEGAAGYYNIKVTGAVYNCGGEYAVYVNGEYAGDIYGYAAASGYESKEWTLSNAIELPEGDVEISLRAVKFYRDRISEGKGGVDVSNNMATIYLGLVELVPTDAPSISAVESTIPTGLSEGDMRDLFAKVKMSDGIYRSFGYTDEGELPTTDNVVTVTSSDTSVIEVTEVVNVEKDIPGDLSQTFDPTTVTYKLAAKKAGTAKITVTAIVDGQEKTTEETITVTGLGADASSDAGTVTLGILTNYAEAADGITTNYNVNGSNQVSVGTAVTAEAKDVGDYKFMYWKVGGTTTKGGTFITADSKLENYVVNTNTSLVAVYEKTNETLKIVEFWNANKQFLSRDDNSDGSITVPTVSNITGFGLTGNWLIGENEYLDLSNLDNITAGTTRAVAEREDAGNAITGSITVNGEAVTEARTYDNKIERKVEGAKYWTRDGNVVFYGETYTYHMWDATAIESHTDDIVAVPTVVLDDPANGAYMIEYCVPEGYTKLEAGILFAKDGSPKIGSFSSKAASQSDSPHGQFTAQADDGENVVRGYLVYEDKTGNKKVIYAELPLAEE